MQRAEVDSYLAALNPKVRKLASASNQVLIGQGCTAYVKTIYIGYDIDGEMVAALYANADHLEVALALPEDAEGDLIVDASHLTWRTLPVAATIRSLSEVERSFTDLVTQACQRVREGRHDVERDNEHFIRFRRERRGSG
jgi:hypothetical protein